MRIENISLKAVTIGILLSLGLLSVCLSYFSGSQFRNAALDAQEKTLSRVVRVAANNQLSELQMEATALGLEIQSYLLDDLTRRFMVDPGNTELKQQINLQFKDVFALQENDEIPLGLVKLRLYNTQFSPMLESTQGQNDLPQGLPPFLQELAEKRDEKNIAQPMGGIWITPSGPRYSALVSVGSPLPHAWLELVVDPIVSLHLIENTVRVPLLIAAADGTELHRSDTWYEGDHTTLPVKLNIDAASGAEALKIVALEDITDLLAVTKRTQWTSTLAFAGISLIGLLIAVFVLNRFIFSPIEKLTGDMGKFAAGDYANAFDTHALKELHTLASGFNTMAKTVHDTIDRTRQEGQDIEGKVELIEDVVEMASKGDLTGQLMVYRDNDVISELANGVQKMLDNLKSLVSSIQQSGIQVTSSATEIAATSKQQEATATEQAATTNEIKATVTEISATSKELVTTMNEVTDVAWKTSESANRGRRSLERMEKTMHHMMEATSSISSKLAVLSEKAGNINTVVTTITKVADQTNLLSLNAAIEAEKAGEYGVGFAVVATEIRRLADQTAVATWDIEQMVKEMQSAVSAGVMGMEKFSEEVRQGVSDVGEVGGQLTEIIEQVEALIPRFEEVHEGMQAQSQAGQQIRDSMVQLSESATQTADSLRQSNGAIQQLNDAARGLQDAASYFKVGD